MNESTTLTLDETMRGFLAPVSIEFHKVSNPGKFKTAFTEGKMNDQQIDLKLKLCFPKSDDLLRNGETSAEVSGSVESHLLGKTCKIINGKASLFSPSPRRASSPPRTSSSKRITLRCKGKCSSVTYARSTCWS